MHIFSRASRQSRMAENKQAYKTYYTRSNYARTAVAEFNIIARSPTRRRRLYHPYRDISWIKGISHNETQCIRDHTSA